MQSSSLIILILSFLSYSYSISVVEITTLISKDKGFTYLDQAEILTKENYSKMINVKVIVDICNPQIMTNLKQMKNLEVLILNFESDISGQCENSILNISALYLKQVKYLTIENVYNYSLNDIRKRIDYIDKRLPNIKQLKFSNIDFFAEETEDQELRDFIQEVKEPKRFELIFYNIRIVTNTESKAKQEMIFNILKDLCSEKFLKEVSFINKS